MADSDYSTRPFREDDYGTWSQIVTRLEPGHPITPKELHSWDGVYRGSSLVKLAFLVEDRRSGGGVAYGSVRQVPNLYHPRRFWVDLLVDPDHQHRGIGRDLYGWLESLAKDRSVEILWTSVKEDDRRSVLFSERAGYSVRRRRWMSRLALDAARPISAGTKARALPSDVILTTLAEEGADRREVRERVYRLDLAASRDEPHVSEMTEISFEEYEKAEFSGPRYFPEATFLARVGDQYVAVSSLHHLPAEPETLGVGFTGTLRAYRGRGLASALKWRAVEFARARGYRYLRTFNDSENPRMWSINERLGFRVEQVWILAEKKFAPSP